MPSPKKLTPRIPGEPIQEAKTTEQAAPAAADPTPVVSRCPGELPEAAKIDPTTLKQPVLTQQGYVVPEK